MVLVGAKVKNYDDLRRLYGIYIYIYFTIPSTELSASAYQTPHLEGRESNFFHLELMFPIHIRFMRIRIQRKISMLIRIQGAIRMHIRIQASLQQSFGDRYRKTKCDHLLNFDNILGRK